MGRQWIVDASNVFGSRPDGWWRDRSGALARLVDQIARWRSTTGAAVVVVADGHPTTRVPEGDHDGVDVRYAHATGPDSADDEIVRLVAGAGDGGSLTVVTSDRRLRDRVAQHGAAVEGAGTFLARLAGGERRRSAPPSRSGHGDGDLAG